MFDVRFGRKRTSTGGVVGVPVSSSNRRILFRVNDILGFWHVGPGGSGRDDSTIGLDEARVALKTGILFLISFADTFRWVGGLARSSLLEWKGFRKGSGWGSWVAIALSIARVVAVVV